MLFSSLLFLYAGLPLVLGVYWLLPGRWRNGWLLLASLLLYAWGGVSYSLLLLGSITVNYALGRAIGAAGSRPRRRAWLGVGLLLNLGALGVVKYGRFAVAEANRLLELGGLPAYPLPRILLPLGISFFTFQAVSYLVDTLREGEGAGPREQRDGWGELGLYLAFFPQLIAGPIVRHRAMRGQIRHRPGPDWNLTARGLERFLLGLARKVLLANGLAGIVDDIFAVDYTTLDAPTAWAGLLLYALQLYHDFAGYSDMAVGLGMLFGFRLPENFDFPYLSRSIREFWRRWHITLGAWFRDYLYVPLGGNRGGAGRTARNLLFVFAVTGLWHGAARNFVLWGLWHGAFVVLERRRWWRFDSLLYAQAVVLLGWVLFRTESLAGAGHYYAALFGGHAGRSVPFDWAFSWDLRLTLVSLAALAFATPLPRDLARGVLRRTTDRGRGWLAGGYALALLVLFLLCSCALATDTLNPFLYFRF